MSLYEINEPVVRERTSDFGYGNNEGSYGPNGSLNKSTIGSVNDFPAARPSHPNSLQVGSAGLGGLDRQKSMAPTVYGDMDPRNKGSVGMPVPAPYEYEYGGSYASVGPGPGFGPSGGGGYARRDDGLR